MTPADADALVPVDSSDDVLTCSSLGAEKFEKLLNKQLNGSRTALKVVSQSFRSIPVYPDQFSDHQRLVRQNYNDMSGVRRNSVITFSHNIPPSRKPSGILQPSYLLLPLECAQSQAARRGYNTHYISMSLFCHPPQHSTHCPSKSAYHRPSSPRSIHSSPSWNAPKADRVRPSPRKHG